MIKEVLIFITLIGATKQKLIKTCPPPEDIPQCTCDWKVGLYITCSELYSPWDLKSISSVLSKYNVISLRLDESYLMYWPKDMFSQLRLKKIEMYNSEVLGLESDDGKEMFEGLETSLDSIYFYNVTGMDTWRWSAFTALKALRDFTIRRGDLVTLTKNFASISPSSIATIRFEYNKINSIHKNAFSNHVGLEEWDLGGNEIEEIDRSMLPKPANNLKSIKLLENKIAAIPDDFFTEMPNLKWVFMAWNRIKFLSQDLFLPMQKGQRFLFDVRFNEIFCCSTLKFMVTAEYKDTVDGSCAYPETLKNTNIRSLTQLDLDHGHC